MRSFKHFNNSGDSKCPVCNTNEDKETVLIGIEGTEDGGNIQAIQVHLDCIELIYKPESVMGRALFYQVLPSEEDRKGKTKNNKWQDPDQKTSSL